jgi:putative hydrolase of the HAD superfamily
VLISIEFGRRKPHPLIFNEALRRLGARPEEALFIGDSLSEDIAGAQSVGMDTAWVNRSGNAPREGAARPTYVISELGGVRGIL